MGIRNRDSCRKYFKRLKILPLKAQYLSLLLFVAGNVDYFRLNSDIHGSNTKNKSNLHLLPSKLTVFQRGPYYSGIKAFNNLPTNIKNLLQTKKQFKWALKEFLHYHSFYSLYDFYNYNKLKWYIIYIFRDNIDCYVLLFNAYIHTFIFKLGHVLYFNT